MLANTLENECRDQAVVASGLSVNMSDLKHHVRLAWSRVATVWPLSNLVATNPMQGYEEYRFSDAWDIASVYSLANIESPELNKLNSQTIKWCQVLLDNRHATIMPAHQRRGLLSRLMHLLKYDHQHIDIMQLQIISKQAGNDAEAVILACMEILMIPQERQSLFLTLLLTALPGWAGYVKYLSGRVPGQQQEMLLFDYLALRVLLATLLWPNAKQLTDFYFNESHEQIRDGVIEKIENHEEKYQQKLLTDLQMFSETPITSDQIDAQFIFCIDPRSEPLRAAIEREDKYVTYGYAGFFGIPLGIANEEDSVKINACPGMVHPVHDVSVQKAKRLKSIYKQSYHALKYAFNTPFLLVDFIGVFSGLSMIAKAFAPKLLKNPSIKNTEFQVDLPFSDKCKYAEQMLVTIGLVKDFATVVVLCAHESVSQNNAYQGALQCGACGGASGQIHARLMTEIMNDVGVRHFLRDRNINIPSDTKFYAAVHVTSSDEIQFLSDDVKLREIKDKLAVSMQQAQVQRLQRLGKRKTSLAALIHNWAQVRPEWGLVNNAALIIGPRNLTKYSNLESRCFLQSYDYRLDVDSSVLASIFAGPLQVAYWINYAYLFSSLDNCHYGSGSKITQNISGKHIIMQGNASDVMPCLPMQSVHQCYDTSCHEPIRLHVVIYAPLVKIRKAILADQNMARLVLNEWLHVFAINPLDGSMSRLSRFFEWDKSLNKNGGVNHAVECKDTASYKT